MNEALEVCIGVYGDTWKAYYAAAECKYVEQFGKLPEWACFIEGFELMPDESHIFVHKDEARMQ